MASPKIVGTSTINRNPGAMASFIGIAYQHNLSIPMLCVLAKLNRENKQLEYTMTIEEQVGGSFDDVVFRSELYGDLFIQAKLKQNPEYIITWEDLTSDPSKPFALSKYLNSFLQNGWDTWKKPLVLALCTNIGLHENLKTLVTKYSFKKKPVDPIIMFITNDVYEIKWKDLKDQTKEELFQYLKQNSELGTLAKVLAQNIFQNKVFDFCKDSVQTKYRSIIENQIAKQTDIKEFYNINKTFFEENEAFKELFENEYTFQHKTELIWADIKKKVYILAEIKPTESKDQNNPNLNLADFAKQLAKHIYDKTAIDFETPVLKKYQNIIDMFFATDDGKKVPVADEKIFNRPDLKHFKRMFEREYENLLKPKGTDVWNDIEKMSKKIRIKTEPVKKSKNESLNEVKLPKPIEYHQIMKFFDSFLIVCNTKHEKNQVTASILKGEVLPENMRKPSSAVITFNEVGMWILDKIRDIKKTINRADVDELFNKLEFLLIFSQSNTLSNSDCNKWPQLRLQCQPKVLQEFKLYKDFLSIPEKVKKNGIEGFIVDIHGYNYPSWVVPQIMQCIDSKPDYLFLEDTQFKPQQEQIMNYFDAMKSSLILVIECKSLPDIKEYIKGRVKGMSSKTIKKIILIGKTDNATEMERDLLVRDLTDKCREQVINQSKIINCFGTETSTSVLFHNEDKLNFFFDIEQLSSEPRMACNKLKESFGKIEDVFIRRKWERCDKKESREISSWSFWSARKEGTTLTKLFPGSETEDQISYKTFLDYNNKKFNTIRLHGNSEYTNPPGIIGNTQDQVQSNKTDRKVHVIFNEAGSGKSFYLTWLATYLQDEHPYWWIIKFNLNEYCMLFDQLKKRDECQTMNELITIRFLFQLVYLSWLVDNMFKIDSNEKLMKAQEIAKALDFSNRCLNLDEKKLKTVSSEELILLRIFVHKFNNKQIIILMDGFDEIVPHYKMVVIKLLSTLKTFDGICKMYLSSRPYGLRNEVETALKDCECYRLVELDQEDQYSIIQRYLLKHFDEHKSSDHTKQTRTCRIVYAILKEVLANLLQIPLFLSMGIELLMPMVRKYISVEEETISKQIIIDCENIFEPLSMVECFVKKKLNIVNTEKTGSTIASSKTPEAMNNAEQKLEKGNETHSLLALYTILSEDDIKELLKEETQNTALRCMEKVNDGSEKWGLIEDVVYKKPIFNHKLFAEYFSALWFYLNRNVTGVKDFLKRKIYETRDRIEIRNFLDRMICRESSLHMNVLNGSIGKMERILTKYPNFITARDDWGRTPLQLSFLLPSSKGSRKIVELLLHWVDKNCANKPDTYFEWLPLDYAYWTDILIPSSNRETLFSYNGPDWHCVVTLLNKGASIDTPEMLTRFSTKEHFMMVVDVLIIEFFTDSKYTSNFETFYTKLVKNLGSDKVFNLKIPIYLPQYSCGGKIGLKFFTKLNQPTRKMIENFSSSIPILEFCIMIDSVMSKIIIGNSYEARFNLKRYNEYFMLALKNRSINVLHYLITDNRQFLNLKATEDNFERELWELLAYLHYDEQEFKSLFHEYCIRHKIPCGEDITHQSEKWKRGFSSQHDLMEMFPTKFEIREDTRIDSGTEFLITQALQLDNVSAVEYLLHKTETNLDNHFIRQICLNCKIKWYCQSSYHFLLNKSKDLTGTDEKGRNLLQFAVGYGDSNLVKCLMKHYDFQPKEINKRENNWNAFFYSVTSCEGGNNSKDIFVLMLEKDPMDCFRQLDTKGKSVFYYAAKNNIKIYDYIIQRQCEKMEDLTSVQIADSIKLLKQLGWNVEDILRYLLNTHFDDELKCKLICDTLESIEELRYHNENGRNLLHIAITEGRFVLAKCLIEHYGFDAKEINAEENNWNAFFYCVFNRNFDVKRKSFFLYIMEKDPIYCFEQRDSIQRNAFNYMYDVDKNFANHILKQECDKLRQLSIEKRVPALFRMLQKSNIFSSIEKILNYLDENHLVDEKSVEIICDYLKTTGELDYRGFWNRNLLHIACMEGWFTLAKCLIEHYGFDAKEINEKDNNRNAFFYCVGNSKNAANKLEIFTYLMKRDPFDCFGQLDSEGKSVFWYATNNNKEIGKEIVKRECKFQEHLPIEKRIPVLMDKLKNSYLNSYRKILQFERNHLVDENSVRIICDYLKTTGELDYREKKTDRNLLHIACMEGWLTLAKCLIEHYGFDAKEINEKENNWNAFFYCVINWGNAANKLEIFTYLMGKDAFDRFGQLDSKNHNVFYYALLNNDLVAEYIIRKELPAINSVSVKEWASMFLKRLSESKLTRTDIDRFLTDWLQYSTLDAKHEIYDEIKKIGKDKLTQN